MNLTLYKGKSSGVVGNPINSKFVRHLALSLTRRIQIAKVHP